MRPTENMKINLCRLCTKKAENTNDDSDLFVKSNKMFLQQIKELTGLTMKDMPRQMMPRYLCSKCKEDLPRACEFRRCIIESQVFFKSKDYKKSFDIDLNEQTGTKKCSPKKIDTEFVSDSNDNKSNGDFDTKQSLSDEFSWCADNTTPVECVETLIEDIKSERCEDDREFIPESEHLISGDNSSEEVNMLESKSINPIKEDEEHIENPAFESKLKENTSREKRANIKVFKEKKVKNKIPKEKKVREKKQKEKTPKERKPRTSDPEKKLSQYVCDKCGASFQSRPGLVAHLLRHTGERKFGCEICEVKFFSPYELQRHMRFHTGEAPYQCRHCERRFRDYSHRQRHERSKHLNVRPFACTTCGKTFTNNYIAKNHMLTHTKLRQFECKICEKYFLRQTHLVTHYRSVTHKNNAAKLEKVGESSEANQTEAARWSSELMLKVLCNQQSSISTNSVEKQNKFQ